VQNHRSTFNDVAEALLLKGDTARARQVLLRSIEVMPDASIPYDFTQALGLQLWFEVGEIEKGVEIARILGDRTDEMAAYMVEKGLINRELYNHIAVLGTIQNVLYQYGEEALAQRYEQAYQKYTEQVPVRFK
jgi:hypothetical protein